jgi:hypothetical protein
MRALDVPARIVTGYQGADPELQDGYHVVRNSHAHAWAEVWLDGRGWVRVDPTAAVAPERVVASRALRAQPGVVAGALAAVNPALMAQWRGLLERLNNDWNQWVLNYSRSQQFDLLQQFGVQSPTWEDLAYVLIALLSGASLIGAGWAWWDRHRRDPWQRLRARVAKRLARIGIEAAAHDAPRTLAARVRAQLGDGADAVAGQLEALDRLRYGRNASARIDPAWWRGFVAATASVRPREFADEFEIPASATLRSPLPGPAAGAYAQPRDRRRRRRCAATQSRAARTRRRRCLRPARRRDAFCR